MQRIYNNTILLNGLLQMLLHVISPITQFLRNSNKTKYTVFIA